MESRLESMNAFTYCEQKSQDRQAAATSLFLIPLGTTAYGFTEILATSSTRICSIMARD
jgi:hypothetical protein